jgi:DNA-binding NarL/FixJ family response regulator
MSLRRPKPTLKLSAEEQETLTGFASSRSLPHALVSRARVVLWSVEGISNAEIAERLNWSKATVGNGASALSTIGCRDSMTNCVPAARAPFPMNRWLCCCGAR